MITEELFLKLDKKFEKKNMLADVAFKMFLSDGYINTKIIDIARKAGVGKGTVYEYFESKESLLLFLIDTRVSREYEGLMKKVADTDGSAVEQLRTFVRMENEFISKYGRYIDDIKMQFFEADNEIAEMIMHSIFKIVHMQFEAVARIVEAGVQSGELCNGNIKLITTTICSVVSSYLTACLGISVPKEVPDEMKEMFSVFEYNEDELLNIILHGIAA